MEGRSEKYTPEEQAKLHKERALSDTEVIKNGAEFTPEGRLIFTEGQKRAAHREMRYEKNTLAYQMLKDWEAGSPRILDKLEWLDSLKNPEDFSRVEAFHKVAIEELQKEAMQLGDFYRKYFGRTGIKGDLDYELFEIYNMLRNKDWGPAGKMASRTLGHMRGMEKGMRAMLQVVEDQPVKRNKKEASSG